MCNKQYLRANAGYKICTAFTSQHAVLLTRVVWTTTARATLMFALIFDLSIISQHARRKGGGVERDRGRCCMKLYCTRCCHSALPPAVHFEQKKKNGNPSKARKFHTFLQGICTIFPFFPLSSPSCPTTPLSVSCI